MGQRAQTLLTTLAVAQNLGVVAAVLRVSVTLPLVAMVAVRYSVLVAERLEEALNPT